MNVNIAKHIVFLLIFSLLGGALINAETKPSVDDVVQNANKGFREMTKEQKISTDNSGFFWPENDPESCPSIKWKHFKNSDTYQKEILTDVIKILRNRNGGTFNDQRVLEAGSWIKRDKKKRIEKNINEYNMKTDQEKERLVRCYEKKIDKKNAEYYQTSVELINLVDKEKNRKIDYISKITRLRSLFDKYKQLIAEEENRKVIFKENLKLFSHTYLIFNYANDEEGADENNKIIPYFDDLAVDRLVLEKSKHYIQKVISRESSSKKKLKFASSLLESFNVEIEKSSSDGIYFYPNTGNRGQLQKYRLVEVTRTSRELRKKRKLPDDITKFKGSVIILGSEDIEIKQVDQKYVCLNCDQLRDEAYEKLTKIAKDENIEGIDKKQKKIEMYINQVFKDNSTMIRKFFKLRGKYQKFIIEQERKKRKNEKELQLTINELRRSKFSSIQTNSSNEPTFRLVEEELNSKSKIIDQLDKSISLAERKNNQHQIVKKNILFSVVDGIKNFSFNKPQLTLKAPIYDRAFSLLHEKACPSVLSKKTEFQNQKKVKKTEGTYSWISQLESFHIPFFRSADIEGDSARHFAIGIILSVKCQLEKMDYSYSHADDLLTDTNENQWRINEHKAYRRKKGETKFEPFSFNTYSPFCKSYTSFLKKHQHDPVIRKYPKIICIHEYVFDKNQQTITVFSSGSIWKILKKQSYADTRAYARDNGWSIYSMERMKSFISELKQSSMEGKQLLHHLKNKRFWTSDDEAEQRILLEFDGENCSDELEEENEKAFGLLYKDMER